MNADSLLIFKIITDILICIGIFFFLIRFRKFFKNGTEEISEEAVQEFRKLISDSREAAVKFLDELEKSKNELKDLAESLDIKEKRLNNLKALSKTSEVILSSVTPSANILEGSNSSSEATYQEVLNLSRQGLNEEQISRKSGLPEGEIDLILNLSRAKSES